MYIFAHFKTFGIFENLMLFDPFLFPSLTSNHGYSYWLSRASRNMRKTGEIRRLLRNALGGPQKWCKMVDFYARFQEGIWAAMHKNDEKCITYEPPATYSSRTEFSGFSGTLKLEHLTPFRAEFIGFTGLRGFTRRTYFFTKRLKKTPLAFKGQ